MYSGFDRETAYLIEVILCALKDKEIPFPPENTDFKKLLKLAKQQEVYSFLAAVLPMSCLPEETAKKLSDNAKSELVRRIAMNNEQSVLEAALEENGIDYMLLKGSVLKALYPKESMRQMSDVDILYDQTKRDALLAIMKDNGYTLYAWSENSDDFSKKPFYTFEFHRELFFDEYNFYPDFSFVWENAVAAEGTAHKMCMKTEDIYLHCVAHIYKHHLIGGFGIRFLCDVYLLLSHYPDMDRAYLDEKLAAIGISDFEKLLAATATSLFDEQPLTDEQQALLAHVMQYGLYGEDDAGIDVKFAEFTEKYQTHSSLKYLWLRLFPEKEFMLRTYPALATKPYLMGYYYFKRLMTKSVLSGDKAVNELKHIHKINKE